MPLKPKELIPAIRVPPGAFQGVRSVVTLSGSSAQGMSGFRARTCRCGGDLAVLHGDDHLEQAGHTGSGLEVAQVRLDRADPERSIHGAAGAQDGPQGLDLDRVAEARAGTVGLDVADLLAAAGRRRRARRG